MQEINLNKMLRLPGYILACLIISWHSQKDQIFHEIKKFKLFINFDRSSFYVLILTLLEVGQSSLFIHHTPSNSL